MVEISVDLLLRRRSAPKPLPNPPPKNDLLEILEPIFNMGAGASSHPDFADEAAALAAGKTEEEISAWKAAQVTATPSESQYLGWRSAAVAGAPPPVLELEEGADLGAESATMMQKVVEALKVRAYNPHHPTYYP